MIQKFNILFAEYKRAYDKDHNINGKKMVISKLPVKVNLDSNII